jgi:2-iminoacetate synthase ThiH
MLPFTTGILVGIGETVEEAIYSIFLIKKLHEEYGHIQEVIIQPFMSKKGIRMENHPPPSEEYFLKLLAISRIILLMEKGMPHELAPSKNPKLRIKMIEEAGKLKIPFTTGILVGIGETVEEAIYSIFLIKKLHEEYGHIQEEKILLQKKLC